ncbi:hypothetical protein WCD74_14755 [Actinomycetospora sp. OC33-EN08]|uniref:DUF11 domain-containing protein n=1 Tax=Actinomycetospora aurantiaca TaxID=3129233 RepID=A0ABU8MQ27_9PSEU
MTANRRRLAVLGGILLVLAGAGVAFAAYLSTGTGTGAAASSVAVNSTITPNTPGAQLFPGSTSTYTVTINNPNPYPVKVTSISASTSDKTSGNCPAGTVTSPAVTNPTGTIAANGTGSYSLTATMIANPDNSCQGQSFTMPLTAQLASAAG